MSEPQQNSNESRGLVAEVTEAIDLQAYWRTVVRRRRLIAPFFLATVLIAGLVASCYDTA
jgi:uncharacterized protein involved in exopolysaccharide biosynthesis